MACNVILCSTVIERIHLTAITRDLVFLVRHCTAIHDQFAHGIFQRNLSNHMQLELSKYQAITPAYHKRGKQHSEPIRIRSKYRHRTSARSGEKTARKPAVCQKSSYTHLNKKFRYKKGKPLLHFTPLWA